MTALLIWGPLFNRKSQKQRLATLGEAAGFRKPALQLQGDGGEEAARAGALFAVAEKERGVAGGAEAGGKDIVVAEAGGEELGAFGFA